jgi:carbon storage regulator CsrA
MLILSRTRDQVVRIGKDITIKIIRLGSRRVQLGIDAPRDVPVYRNEIDPLIRKAPPSLQEPLDLRVFVVEDTAIHAALIKKALLKHGVTQVTVVSSGEEALDNLGLNGSEPPTGQRPHLILLDLQLLNMTGFEVLESLRSTPQFRSTPIVVLSSHDSQTEVDRCMSAGANAFISKVEEYDEFRKSIFTVVDFWSTARKAG